MNKSQLIEELSKRVGNDKEEIRYILEELNNIILEKTRAGEKVCIQGFGVYTPRLQTSRLARNPKSGETLMLIPRTIVHFKCAPNLLKEINKGSAPPGTDLFVIPLMTYQRQHSIIYINICRAYFTQVPTSFTESDQGLISYSSSISQ